MKNTSKFISLLLALILAGSAVGCGSSGTSSDTTTANSGNTTTAPVDDGRVRDDLPEIDMGGKTVNILVREEVDYEFSAEQTGDIIDDAIYKRNADISERFNVNIEYILKPGLWASNAEFQGLISGAVLANDPVYDIVTGQSNIVLPLAQQHYYVDVADQQYLDLTKPYWKSGYIENVKINDHLYTLCGDYALTTLTMSNVIFFNKSLFDDYSIEYPYQSVKDGSWTLDKFLSIVADSAVDLNGDSQISQGDLFGFAAYNNSVVPFTYSCGISMTTPGSDGVRYLDFPDEKAIDVFDKIYALCHSEDFLDTSNVKSITGQPEGDMAIAFKNGEYLMMGMTLENVENLRDMDVDFGILPYPKYDESQENYVTSLLRRLTVASIPISAADYDTSAIILEAMGSYGYNDILPTYYEVALKGKYTRDDDSSEMLDIISASAYFDFMDAYYLDLGTHSDFLSSYALGSSQGVASKFESIRKTLEGYLEKLYAAYED